MVGLNEDRADQRGRIEFAHRRDLIKELVPDAAHPEQIGLFRGVRGLIEDVGFTGRFVLANPDQMNIDAKPVERIAVIAAVTGEAFKQDRALRVQQDLIGMRGQVVLALFHALGNDDDIFLRRAKAIQGLAEFAHG